MFFGNCEMLIVLLAILLTKSWGFHVWRDCCSLCAFSAPQVLYSICIIYIFFFSFSYQKYSSTISAYFVLFCVCVCVRVWNLFWLPPTPFRWFIVNFFTTVSTLSFIHVHTVQTAQILLFSNYIMQPESLRLFISLVCAVSLPTNKQNLL